MSSTTSTTTSLSDDNEDTTTTALTTTNSNSNNNIGHHINDDSHSNGSNNNLSSKQQQQQQQHQVVPWDPTSSKNFFSSKQQHHLHWDPFYAPLRETIAYLQLNNTLAGIRCSARQLIGPLNSLLEQQEWEWRGINGKELAHGVDVVGGGIDKHLIKKAFTLKQLNDADKNNNNNNSSSRNGEEYSVSYRDMNIPEGGTGVLYCRVDKHMGGGSCLGGLPSSSSSRGRGRVTDFGFFKNDIDGMLSREMPLRHPLSRSTYANPNQMIKLGVPTRVKEKLNEFMKEVKKEEERRRRRKSRKSEKKKKKSKKYKKKHKKKKRRDEEEEEGDEAREERKKRSSSVRRRSSSHRRSSNDTSNGDNIDSSSHRRRSKSTQKTKSKSFHLPSDDGNDGGQTKDMKSFQAAANSIHGKGRKPKSKSFHGGPSTQHHYHHDASNYDIGSSKGHERSKSCSRRQSGTSAISKPKSKSFHVANNDNYRDSDGGTARQQKSKSFHGGEPRREQHDKDGEGINRLHTVSTLLMSKDEDDDNSIHDNHREGGITEYENESDNDDDERGSSDGSTSLLIATVAATIKNSQPDSDSIHTEYNNDDVPQSAELEGESDIILQNDIDDDEGEVAYFELPIYNDERRLKLWGGGGKPLKTKLHDGGATPSSMLLSSRNKFKSSVGTNASSMTSQVSLDMLELMDREENNTNNSDVPTAFDSDIRMMISEQLQPDDEHDIGDGEENDNDMASSYFMTSVGSLDGASYLTNNKNTQVQPWGENHHGSSRPSYIEEGVEEDDEEEDAREEDDYSVGWDAAAGKGRENYNVSGGISNNAMVGEEAGNGADEGAGDSAPFAAASAPDHDSGIMSSYVYDLAPRWMENESDSYVQKMEDSLNTVPSQPAAAAAQVQPTNSSLFFQEEGTATFTTFEVPTFADDDGSKGRRKELIRRRGGDINLQGHQSSTSQSRLRRSSITSLGSLESMSSLESLQSEMYNDVIDDDIVEQQQQQQQVPARQQRMKDKFLVSSLGSVDPATFMIQQMQDELRQQQQQQHESMSNSQGEDEEIASPSRHFPNQEYLDELQNQEYLDELSQSAAGDEEGGGGGVNNDANNNERLDVIDNIIVKSFQESGRWNECSLNQGVSMRSLNYNAVADDLHAGNNDAFDDGISDIDESDHIDRKYTNEHNEDGQEGDCDFATKAYRIARKYDRIDFGNMHMDKTKAWNENKDMTIATRAFIGLGFAFSVVGHKTRALDCFRQAFLAHQNDDIHQSYDARRSLLSSVSESSIMNLNISDVMFEMGSQQNRGYDDNNMEDATNGFHFALEVRKALLGDSFVILQRAPDGSQELKPNIDKELFSLAPNLEEAIRICQDEFEDEHLLSEKIVHALAVLNKRKGDYLSSSIWFEKELKMRMMLGANDERVAYVYNELGECYYNLGRYEHAISTFLDCMRITLLREEDMRLEVADILDKIANCHDNLCNYNEALEKFSEVKQIRMSLLGAESNAVMQTMLCIGKILLRKEEVKQALGLPGEDTEEVIGTFEEYARLQKQRPQSNARDGANICYAEGIVAKLRGQHDTALSLFKHALAMFETLFDGEHHETIASIHFDIGCVESAMGYWEAALSHFQTCLLQRRNLMGVHVDVAEALYEMASIYNHQGKTKFAIKCLRESDRILKAKLVNGNEKLASVLLDSAKLWKSLQCYRPAEENFEQALEQAIAIYGHEHELAASILLSLGELLQEMNQIQQALFCYDESITVRTKIFGPDSTSVAQVLYNKGVALLLNEEFNEASNCLNQALTIREEKLGPMDSDVGDTLNTIGFLHLRMGNWSGDEALEPLTRALGVRRAVGNLSKIASTLQNMASVYKKRNDLDSCIKIHVEILSLRLEEYGTNDARVATAWIKLGNMQMSAGRLNEATVSYKEALRIRTLLYSRHHVSVAEVLFKMGSLNLIQGNNCDAKQMFEEYMRIRAHEEECPDKEMARALKLMGELPNSSSETSESQDNWSAVLEIFEQMGHTERHPSMYTPRAK